MQLRLVCGLLASAARLTPIPLLDDVLRQKALQLLVSRTLKANGRTYRSKLVAPLYGDDHGCAYGCLVWLALFPIKLIIFPIRKVLTWILAAKHLARDLSEAVLLGRALDRSLAAGRLSADDPVVLRSEAELLRRAFANALAGTDMVLLRRALTGALRSVSGLPRAALHALRGLRKRSEDADPVGGLDRADRAKVEEGARRVESVLESEEMQAFLARFDATFDENLRILEGRAVAPA